MVVICPNPDCGARLRVPDGVTNFSGKCPNCKTAVVAAPQRQLVPAAPPPGDGVDDGPRERAAPPANRGAAPPVPPPTSPAPARSLPSGSGLPQPPVERPAPPAKSETPAPPAPNSGGVSGWTLAAAILLLIGAPISTAIQLFMWTVGGFDDLNLEGWRAIYTISLVASLFFTGVPLSLFFFALTADMRKAVALGAIGRTARPAAVLVLIGIAVSMGIQCIAWAVGASEAFDYDRWRTGYSFSLLAGLLFTYVPLVRFFFVLRSARRATLNPVSKSTPVANANSPADVKPLGDPLLTTRRVLGWVLLLSVPLWPLMGPVLLIWLILPARRTNAFYLRSFRNDPATWPRRKAAQRALGSKFRLSGIRDPRRRRSLLDWLGWGFFVLRYATPRYMDLEAGFDWKRRLWRSLADARCALVDSTDITPFVHEEVELCYACLGLERLLFVCDASKDEAEWRLMIAKELLRDERRAKEVKVAIWSDEDRESVRAYRDAVKQFAQHLPAGTAGLRPSAYGLAQTATGPAGPPVPVHTGWGFVGRWALTAPIALGLGALLAYIGLALGLHPDAISSATTLAFVGVLGAIFAWMFGALIVDSALPSQRVRAIVGLLMIPLPPAMLLPAVQQTRAAADRVACSSNLRQIGQALRFYQETHGDFPPAYTVDDRGRPLHSWRVEILPFLEQEFLYFRIDSGAPWNSPQNSALHDEMPDVFRCPSQDEQEMTSPYMLVIDRGYLRDRPEGWGASRILVIESGSAAGNWMDPTPSEIDAFGPGTGVSAHSSHSGGTHAVLETGEVVFLTNEEVSGLLSTAKREAAPPSEAESAEVPESMEDAAPAEQLAPVQ